MKMKFTKIYVDNQDKALTFYTEVLGFVKKADFLVGSFRWLTVVSPEEPDGTELLLDSLPEAIALALRRLYSESVALHRSRAIIAPAARRSASASVSEPMVMRK